MNKYMPGIIIKKARENNLKDIDLFLPLYKLICVCGVSGSGKSSLVYNVIYQEAQRRFIDTISPYARQFLGRIQPPDVDTIDYLPAAIATKQKGQIWNPRSTVGTTTEIYDLLRVLYSKCAIPYSPYTHKPMIKVPKTEITRKIMELYKGRRANIYSMVVRSRKGHYRELLASMLRKGFSVAIIDGKKQIIEFGMALDRYSNHTIEVMLDSFVIGDGDLSKSRIERAVNNAFEMGDVLTIETEDGKFRRFGKEWYCPDSNFSIPGPDPALFAFNHPYGYCNTCYGLGYINGLNYKFYFNKNYPLEKSLPNDLPDREEVFKDLNKILDYWKIPKSTEIQKMPSYVIYTLLYGLNIEDEEETFIPGLIGDRDYSSWYWGKRQKIKEYYDRIFQQNPIDDIEMEYSCPSCKGARLRKEALLFKIDNKDIHDVATMEISELKEWLYTLPDVVEKSSRQILDEILPDLQKRVNLLLGLGLEYLTLDRSMATLSGGESQNVRLVAQFCGGLREVLYILDEPTIGMHPLNTKRMIEILKEVVKEGNTILVVEHDHDVIKNSDWIIELGPEGGKNGGKIVFSGSIQDFLKANTITTKSILEPVLMHGNLQTDAQNNKELKYKKYITLSGASGNNLKNVTLKIPLNALVGVCGVSGSGKSSLIMDTLYPALSAMLKGKNVLEFAKCLPFKRITGYEDIKRVVAVDQSPIGKTPRSNVATYTGAMDIIRKLFASTVEAQALGLTPSHFSFNVKGGRCEECEGSGKIKIEMKYLPDVFITCSSCLGKRFYPHILKVKYKGKSIYDVLEMYIDEAYEFFENMPSLKRILGLLIKAGLYYLKLGQLSSSLSGGESLRIKIVYELAKAKPFKTIYLLDEPTIGLHTQDILKIINILKEIVSLGNTVVVIEHNPEFLLQCDYIIEMGPGGGKKGGKIIAEGTPQEILNSPNSIIKKFLTPYIQESIKISNKKKNYEFAKSN